MLIFAGTGTFTKAKFDTAKDELSHLGYATAFFDANNRKNLCIPLSFIPFLLRILCTIIFCLLALCESQRLCVSASNCYLLPASASLRQIAICCQPPRLCVQLLFAVSLRVSASNCYLLPASASLLPSKCLDGERKSTLKIVQSRARHYREDYLSYEYPFLSEDICSKRPI